MTSSAAMRSDTFAHDAPKVDFGTATGEVNSMDLFRQKLDQSKSAREFEVEGTFTDRAGVSGSAMAISPSSWTADFKRLGQRTQLKAPDVRSFVVLQEWEGYVLSLNENEETFSARLIDKTAHHETEREIVELPLSDLTANERKLIRTGSIFRWTIGYETSKSGIRKRTSQIVFRQLPQWSERELKEAAMEGRSRSERVQWK